MIFRTATFFQEKWTNSHELRIEKQLSCVEISSGSLAFTCTHLDFTFYSRVVAMGNCENKRRRNERIQKMEYDLQYYD